MKLILTLIMSLLFLSTNAQMSTSLSYKTVLGMKPISKPQNLLLRKSEEKKMPLIPKLTACTSVLLIGVYGYSTNTKVMPSMVGVGFLYGAYHLRTQYKDDSYILPLLAGIGSFAIQAFVVRVPQKI